MTLPDTNITSLADSEHAYSTEAPDINVTSAASPDKRAMTGAERARLHRQRQKGERLRYTSDEWRAFVDPAGLARKAGVGWRSMPAMVLRELCDNAADAAGAGAWIETVTIDGTAWWCVGDNGNGIAPDQVAYVFSVNRPMVSSKHVRLPTRGMLGNGTRVAAGFCAIERLPIMVESRDRQTVLRVERATGHTIIERQEPIAPITGTRIYLPKIAGLDGSSVADLAQKTLALAAPASDARIYSGPSNPWWYGATDMARLLVTAPPGTSIGDVVRDLGVRLPRGVPDGLAAEATEERAAALLTALRERYEPLPAERIGRVGRDAFGDKYPGYAIEHFTRSMRSGARLPLTVEVWAKCDGWKRRDMSVSAGVDTFLNRAAVLAGIGASGGNEQMLLQGAGITWEPVTAKPGRYQLVVSIITPQAELLSDGKAPNFGYLTDALAGIVGNAMKRARRGVPPDDATEQELAAAEAEAKADKRAKEAQAERREEGRRQREAEEVEWQAIKGNDVLARTIVAAATAANVPVESLTVGGRVSDPYRMNTPPNHHRGKWLAKHIADHLPADTTIHLRGLHYLLVSIPDLVRPDGKPYRNDNTSWDWLGKALTVARWLKYVSFDKIEDERNTDPVWAPAPDAVSPAECVVDASDLLPDAPELNDLVPNVRMNWYGADRQRFHLCLLGEKTGLRPVLAPLAEEFGADLLLPSGEPSVTMVHQLVMRAIADGRPLVILTFCDADPTGQGIPASVARKVQAGLELAGRSDLPVLVIPAGLTVEQANELDLPHAPLKKTDKRRKRWEAETGRGQTEIDALLALRRDVLVQMARDAIARFYDTDLARRVQEAQDAWEADARRSVNAALDRVPEHRATLRLLEEQYKAHAAAQAEIIAAIGKIRAVVLRETERPEMPALPAFPEWQAPDAPVATVLFDSADSFVANTLRMKKAKLHDVDETPEDETPDDDEEEGDAGGGA